MSRKDRLIEVYEYLRSHYPIHTKNDFAEKIKYHRTYISSAMNGNERYLTDKLFTNICEAYPGTFNLDYLLNGRGVLLIHKEESKTEKKDHGQQPMIDVTAIIEKAVEIAVSSKNETIDGLRSQMADLRIQLVQRDQTIEDKKKIIEEKDNIIALLHQRIASLEATQAIYEYQDPTKDYPFKTGVADRHDNDTTRV